jgi:hypothetical protein
VKRKEEDNAKKEMKREDREERDAKKKVKPKEWKTILGEGWCEPLSASTVVSLFRQEVEPGQTDPGRLTVRSAKEAGFHSIEIIDKSLTENIKQQLMRCTATKHILPIDHPGVPDLIKLLQKVFYKGENKRRSLCTNHANFHSPKGLKQIYNEVALTAFKL